MHKTCARNWIRGVEGMLVDGSKSELWPKSAAKQNQESGWMQKRGRDTADGPSLWTSVIPLVSIFTHTHVHKHKPDSLLSQMASSRSREKWGRLVNYGVRPFWPDAAHGPQRGWTGWDHHVWCGGGVAVGAEADFLSEVSHSIQIFYRKKKLRVVEKAELICSFKEPTCPFSITFYDISLQGRKGRWVWHQRSRLITACVSVCLLCPVFSN